MKGIPTDEEISRNYKSTAVSVREGNGTTGGSEASVGNVKLTGTKSLDIIWRIVVKPVTLVVEYLFSLVITSILGDGSNYYFTRRVSLRLRPTLKRQPSLRARTYRVNKRKLAQVDGRGRWAW